MHLSELDDPTPYLEGGELLLTAGIPLTNGIPLISDDPERIGSYVGRLVARGVVALGGWAVYLPADGSQETYWSLSASQRLPCLREQTERFDLSGTRVAASFAMHGAHVLEHSSIDGTRAAGFLAVSAGRPLRAADRQLIVTGCMMLAKTAQREWQFIRANSILNNTAATLVVNGFVDAARLMVADLAGAPLAERVQLLAVRGGNIAGRSTAELAGQLTDAVGGAAADRLCGSIGRSRLRYVAGGLTYLVL